MLQNDVIMLQNDVIMLQNDVIMLQNDELCFKMMNYDPKSIFKNIFDAYENNF